MDAFGKKDAIALIDKKVDTAVELCCNNNEDYIKELVTAYEMIEDFFQVIGYDPKTYVKPL